MQDLQLICIHTRGHRQRLLRDIRKIPRLDIEEDIPVSFLMTGTNGLKSGLNSHLFFSHLS